MKQTLYGLAALGLLFIASCNKSDDNNNTPANTFVINGTTYTATNVQRVSLSGLNELVATSVSGSTSTGLYFAFGTNPTASGSYKVVSSSSPAANQVTIQTISNAGGTTTSYASTGNDNVSATVSVNSSKLTITVPQFTAKKVIGGGTTDSIKISANAITEP